MEGTKNEDVHNRGEEVNFSLDVTASPCSCVIVCCHAFFYYLLNYHCASVILESTCIFACFQYIWIFFLISLCTLIFLQSN
jgi:hypothetical protein